MLNMWKSILKYLILFIIYGGIYFVIESIYKGYITDYRMFILGGVIGILIGLINNLFSFNTNFILQCWTGTMITLLSECIFGYQWNIIENLHLWDYSQLPCSFVGGQINLFFAIVWMLLSAVGIVLDDYLRWKIFNEEKPHYTIKEVE